MSYRVETRDKVDRRWHTFQSCDTYEDAERLAERLYREGHAVLVARNEAHNNAYIWCKGADRHRTYFTRN